VKGIGAFQRHQLPHPPCKNPASATGARAGAGRSTCRRHCLNVWRLVDSRHFDRYPYGMRNAVVVRIIPTKNVCTLAIRNLLIRAACRASACLSRPTAADGFVDERQVAASSCCARCGLTPAADMGRKAAALDRTDRQTDT